MTQLRGEQFFGLQYEIETAIMLTDHGIKSVWEPE